MNDCREDPVPGGPGGEGVRGSLPRMIEEQVRRTPDAVAVRCDQDVLTYGELNRRANILAWQLTDAGVGAESPVGVLLGRSVGLVVALLGVLKSGGFYVPIDVATPAARVRSLLDDAGAAALVTAAAHASAAAGFAGLTLYLDGAHPEAERLRGTEDPAGRCTPDSPAYLIYTSGSTGKPKGVVVLHRGLANYVAWAAEAYRVAEGSGALVHGSPAFDLIMTGLYCPLVAGRTVDILPEGAGPDQLARALTRGRHYSLVKLTPAHLELLRTLIPPEESADLARHFIVGGEALDGKLAAEWRERAPGTRIVNEYGPTETVVGCCAYFIPSDGDLPSCIPIGRPIAGTHMYVLDASLNEVPPGEPGELYIGGAGVARGYLHRPDLTRERFLPDPHVPGGRMYRSGDRARVGEEGAFVYLGRNDDQVKIRGYRVEPGEVESVLRSHPAVREAAVIPRNEGGRDASLVAFVVPSQAGEDLSRILKEFLSARLPDYMIPAGLVWLDAMPLTSNGKIDRKSLLERVPRHATTFAPPRTDVEKVVAEWWKEILGIESVSTTDSFFDLGGHSLLVAQVLSRAREKYGVRLPYREIFDHPELASLASVIEWSLAHPDAADPMAIRPSVRPERIPLSFSQEAVWFFQQLQPDNVAYNAQTMLTFVGDLDVSALERALTEMIVRHEILRTSFHADDVGPVQVVHSPAPYRLPVVDLGGNDVASRDADLARLVRDEVRKQFDPGTFPLIRCTLFRRSPREHVFLLVEHHFVHDGWSVNLFLGELRELYAAFVAGRPSPLPPLSLQFADYALWQRGWMMSVDAARQLAFWKTRLAGLPPVQDLPSDRPRPEVQAFEGASFRHDLPEDLCEALRSFSHQEGVSLFMTMLGTFMTLLHRYSGRDDICIGSATGNRTTPQTEKLLGMMVNTVAMRLDFSDNPTVREMLNRAREMCLEAYAHQSVPFEKVVEAIRPERSHRHLPVYQAFFGFHDSPITELLFPGVTTELNDTLGNGSAKVDIALVAIPRSEQLTRSRSARRNRGITFKWEYDTSLYDEATMRRMVDHFEMLLRGVVSDPGTRVSALCLLPEGERARLLGEPGRTVGTHPHGVGIVCLFREQVARQPESRALVCNGVTMSYGELDRLSTQCGRYLRGQGVGPGSVVGLTIDRSFEMIVGMLGILKAGCAYLPLEGSTPDGRLEYMVREARVSIVVTMSAQAARLRALGMRVVCLDGDREEIAREPEEELQVTVTGESLAYAMYTSGSTGRPKCVGVPHDAVVRLVCGVTYVHLGPEEVLLQNAPVSFDVSTFEIWGALLNGGTLVLMPAGRYSLEEVGEVVQSAQVTTMALTATVFHHLVDGPLELFGGVRQLVVGGDVLSVSHVRKFVRRFPHCTMINAYGPTESTTIASSFTVRDLETLGISVPIGRPINGTYVYVLDSHRELTPVGVPGELYIGGEGLATGYLHRPELTEERFVADPFRPGSRIYRSGDRVRYLADGNIEFMGRMDAQVKLRGYRIEPGEIEAVLGEHASVRESVVLVREDVPGEKYLAAYLTAHPGRTIDQAAVTGHLRARLPEYMVPAAWVILEEFPVTPNGKIDRHALPPPRAERRAPAVGTGGVLAGKIEREIAEIWRTLLGRVEVRGDDDFFALGGHSLLAMQFVTRMKSTLDVTIRLADVFRFPTVQALALLIEDHLLRQMESMSAEDIARWLL